MTTGQLRRCLLVAIIGLCGCRIGGPVGPPAAHAQTPNAERIAFVSTSSGISQIYVMEADGSAQRRVTQTPGPAETLDCGWPAWSPDGTRIAFSPHTRIPREAGQTAFIHVINADGTALRALTAGAVEDTHPTWSPDGLRIAFSRRTGEDLANICVVAASGGPVQQLTSGNVDDTSPDWSPDGQTIAFIRTQQETGNIWLVGADGSHLRALTTYPPQPRWPAGGLSCSDPAWSPDGRTIAYAEGALGDIRSCGLATINSDGGGHRRLLEDKTGMKPGQPAWSPDGRRLAFVDRVGASFDIFVLDLATQAVTRLTQSVPAGRDWNGYSGEADWWGPPPGMSGR